MNGGTFIGPSWCDGLVSRTLTPTEVSSPATRREGGDFGADRARVSSRIEHTLIRLERAGWSQLPYEMRVEETAGPPEATRGGAA
jgi:hypothetical protein